MADVAFDLISGEWGKVGQNNFLTHTKKIYKLQDFCLCYIVERALTWLTILDKAWHQPHKHRVKVCGKGEECDSSSYSASSGHSGTSHPNCFNFFDDRLVILHISVRLSWDFALNHEIIFITAFKWYKCKMMHKCVGNGCWNCIQILIILERVRDLNLGPLTHHATDLPSELLSSKNIRFTFQAIRS